MLRDPDRKWTDSSQTSKNCHSQPHVAVGRDPDQGPCHAHVIHLDRRRKHRQPKKTPGCQGDQCLKSNRNGRINDISGPWVPLPPRARVFWIVDVGPSVLRQDIRGVVSATVSVDTILRAPASTCCARTDFWPSWSNRREHAAEGISDLPRSANPGKDEISARHRNELYYSASFPAIAELSNDAVGSWGLK